MGSKPLFKIMDPAGIAFTAVNYNAKKEEKRASKLICFRNFGPLQEREHISKDEFTNYLKNYSARNKRIKKPVFHAVCSIKGRELTHDELKIIALEVINGLGYQDNPTLIYSHHDTANNHVHIVSSRVGRDGKKINDSFEKKRANSILNAVINRNTHQEYNLDINTALQYQFNTTRQFTLLMENKGYKALKKQGEVLFYKGGELQGSIRLSELERKSSKNYAEGEKEIRKIQAVIYKYKKEYSSRLKSNREIKHTTEKLQYHSDLTEHLKKYFGLEFVFFAGRDHDKPYGYTLIDHNNKKVYKGSEVFSLYRLMDNTIFMRESHKIFSSLIGKFDEHYRENSYKPEEREQSQAPLFNDNLQITSAGANTPPPKKKKKKRFKR